MAEIPVNLSDSDKRIAVNSRHEESRLSSGAKTIAYWDVPYETDFDGFCRRCGRRGTVRKLKGRC